MVSVESIGGKYALDRTGMFLVKKGRDKMRRLSVLAAILVTLSLILAACQVAPTPTATPKPAPTPVAPLAAPTPTLKPAGPTGKITIALGSEPTTLDPQLRDEGPLWHT